MRFYKMKMVGQSSQLQWAFSSFDYNDLFQLEAGHLQVSYRLLTLDGEQEFANYQLLVEWEE
ncbi:MAG: hypothetical protein ACLT9W_02245 [Streptococcus sp.]